MPKLENPSVEPPVYQRLIRPLLFRCDPEWTHDRSIAVAELFGRVPGATTVLRRLVRSQQPCLRTTVAGIEFENPVGLAAGYDKSGRAISALSGLGFGHIEIGSISASPSAGNPRPRLWRLPRDEALCVHYGLPNQGAQRIAVRLQGQSFAVPVGINLVNTNFGPDAVPSSADQIIDDYVRSASLLSPFAAYLMLNLSCPNTADGRDFFGDTDSLNRLLERISALPIAVPLFLKIAPETNDASIDRILAICDSFDRVGGFMFNLSPVRRDGLSTPPAEWQDYPGAISGVPTRHWMDQRIANLYRQMDKTRYRIIAAGGVCSGADAYQKIRSGASLVQLFTALIYRGPRVVQRINRELAALLAQDGYRTVSEAVGTSVSFET
ncbi:quinone-dependent dihydroorotate dehydrogenase [Stieleria sp. TO1_6]|uniref:quinone-dependent dihydroorotate dehydrogenase n=1 Tax=Stieleria tagensis TaxID=2956795 RepID=UPI00209ACAAA|nr:quinone-dependent dihydroorotate dehydrogenase [Stieleria tagensis]MCO8122329.1 quinone-dependent dihydroorotate dehydrogenase [Stieleria tagensis]